MNDRDLLEVLVEKVYPDQSFEWNEPMQRMARFLDKEKRDWAGWFNPLTDHVDFFWLLVKCGHNPFHYGFEPPMLQGWSHSRDPNWVPVLRSEEPEKLMVSMVRNCAGLPLKDQSEKEAIK